MAATVTRSVLSSDLAVAVTTLIAEQGLQVGDAIPSLRSLADRFGVAVPTLREALRRLEGVGILEFRHGSGVYVGQDVHRVVLANPVAPRPSGERLGTLLAARLVLEPPIAALAATVRDPAGLDRLNQSLVHAQSCLADGDPGLARANSAVHAAVAACTGNSVLTETLDSLARVHAHEQAHILELFGDARRDFDEHAAIVAAINAGDSQRAHELMAEHLQEVLDVVQARQAAQSVVRTESEAS